MMRDAPTKLDNTKYTKESSLVLHFLPSNMDNTHNARLFEVLLFTNNCDMQQKTENCDRKLKLDCYKQIFMIGESETDDL